MELPRARVAALLAVLVAVAGLLIVLLALHLADGATLVSGTTYDTEFIDGRVLSLAWLLVPVVGTTAYLSTPWGILAGLAATASQLYGAAETVHRYRVSGWADGLEVFAYLWPIGVLGLSAVAVLVGALARLAQRREQYAG